MLPNLWSRRVLPGTRVPGKGKVNISFLSVIILEGGGGGGGGGGGVEKKSKKVVKCRFCVNCC